MPLDTLTANRIGAQDGDFELQRGNNGLLFLVGLEDIGNVDNIITLALSTFPVPKVNSGIIDVPYLNESRKFPGKPVFDDLSVVCRDYVDKNVAGVLLRWRQLVYDHNTGVIGRAASLKKQARIELFSPQNDFVREYTLIGVWPSQFDGGEIDMAADEGVQITLTLTYDKFIPGPGLQ